MRRRELEAEEEGCASLNNESIDPPADDGSGCYDDRCSGTRSVEERFVSQKRALKAEPCPIRNRRLNVLFYILYSVFVVEMLQQGEVTSNRENLKHTHVLSFFFPHTPPSCLGKKRTCLLCLRVCILLPRKRS